ncbi:deoxyribose-phosphate aldolase [[Mycoplasma] gypis]|uniref:Deoxyribose-phosphate aldolase n=1 Tax=[Mycoplasma] gypis TaxID=92404 RepID=A0ABZ2RR36_9BACT|nr:deoxyribose-phosphate aldolase [[Mycoplasma] gypis]MBN0919406.1 deoxyribose-phosphate aldolase [[Mycoplasma] gypis]
MNYNRMVDHTLLKPEATQKDIDKLISEAIEYDFKSVCINPTWIKHAKEKLAGSNTIVCTVVGFPLGAMVTQAKVHETKLAISHGADEVDMVINIGRFKQGQYDYVLNEIKAIKEECKGKVLKVIIETALLTNQEIQKATEIVLQSGADFVKTSTGFSYRGANFEDIEIMKSVVGDKIEIKAAGGIKTYQDMEKMYQLGATRFGMSKSVEVFKSKN